MNMLINEAKAFMLGRKRYRSSSKQRMIAEAMMNLFLEKSTREQLHSKRVSTYSVLIARAIGLTEHKINGIKTAGLLHDIGKLCIDEAILDKPFALNDQEWMIMKQHSIISAKILIGFDVYPEIVPIVRAHHERIDGSGYPDGLKGESIPIEARIIAVADAFDAMTEDRPYRKAISRSEAKAELVRCSGSQFDPKVIRAFIGEVLDSFESDDQSINSEYDKS